MLSENVILFLAGQTLVLAGGGIATYISVVSRIVKLETRFEMLGIKAAKVLHSDDTPQLDRLLEKYIDRHYELSFAEWEELLSRCLTIENDTKMPKATRALAGFIIAVSSHKMMKEPPKFKPHYDDATFLQTDNTKTKYHKKSSL